MLTGPVMSSQRKRIVDLALKSRLPSMYDRAEFVEDGGLMSYGANSADLLPARRHVRGQNSERRQARRSPGGAADEVRVHHQSESGEADRPDDSAQCAGASG